MSQFKALSDCYKVYKVSSFRISHCAATDGQIDKINKLTIRVKQLEKGNAFLGKDLESFRESHEKLLRSKREIERELERQKGKTVFATLFLALVVASQWVAIFLQ